MLQKDEQLDVCFEYNEQLHVLENEQDICEPMPTGNTPGSGVNIQNKVVI